MASIRFNPLGTAHLKGDVYGGLTAAIVALPLALGEVPLLGAMPSGLLQLQLPAIDFALLNEMLVSAAVLAALGSVDSLLTSLVADNVTRSYHDSDQERSARASATSLLAIALSLGGLIAWIPHAALAGILLKVGYDVIDWRFVQRLPRAPRMDQVVMLVVLVLTVFVDVITAVGVGIVIASLVFVKEK